MYYKANMSMVKVNLDPFSCCVLLVAILDEKEKIDLIENLPSDVVQFKGTSSYFWSNNWNRKLTKVYSLSYSENSFYFVEIILIIPL